MFPAEKDPSGGMPLSLPVSLEKAQSFYGRSRVLDRDRTTTMVEAGKMAIMKGSSAGQGHRADCMRSEISSLIPR